MIVILNNGTRIRIPKEMAQALVQGLLKSRESAEKWFCVIDTQNNATSAFNPVHIAAICAEEGIIAEPPSK